MFKKRKISYVFILFIINGLIFSHLMSQDKQEITVTIDNLPSTINNPDFLKGEEYREQSRFLEAIAEYEKVLLSNESEQNKAIVQYNIGICYTWLGKTKEAESVFEGIIKEYPKEYKTIAYVNYGLSWIDIRKLDFETAINRLQQTLDADLCTDERFLSRAQFQIGRIYLLHLKDNEKAESVFNEVLDKYPNSKITDHPFLKELLNRQ